MSEEVIEAKEEGSRICIIVLGKEDALREWIYIIICVLLFFVRKPKAYWPHPFNSILLDSMLVKRILRNMVSLVGQGYQKSFRFPCISISWSAGLYDVICQDGYAP